MKFLSPSPHQHLMLGSDSPYIAKDIRSKAYGRDSAMARSAVFAALTPAGPIGRQDDTTRRRRRRRRPRTTRG
ncbi:hypothetical protein BH20ACT5_BH20ACT5_23580 [soil metagenome]